MIMATTLERRVEKKNAMHAHITVVPPKNRTHQRETIRSLQQDTMNRLEMVNFFEHIVLPTTINDNHRLLFVVVVLLL